MIRIRRGTAIRWGLGRATRWFDYKGHPHTEKLHTIERHTRADLMHMAIEVNDRRSGVGAR
jgi:hypothetical protein